MGIIGCMQLESFLAHARTRVVTPQKVPIRATPLSDLILSTHAVSSILLTGGEASLTERGFLAVIAAVALQTSLERLGKAFSVARTSRLNTLFGVGVSVKHRHVSMCWKKLLMILA